MDRILTTHTGSLIRTPELDSDLLASERGDSFDERQFEENLQKAVHSVVREQADVGLDVINDGEYDKNMWITYIFQRVTGVEPRVVHFDTEKILDAIPEYMSRYSIGRDNLYNEVSRFVPFWTRNWRVSGDAVGWVCNGPISYDSTSLDRHLANLRQAVDGVSSEGVFVTAVAPASIVWIVNEYYDTEEEFVLAMAEALGEEYRRIVDAGFLLQVDDAVLWRQYATIQMSGGTPADYARWADFRVEALNRALDGIPRDRVRYHICSGSGRSPHVLDPTLKDVLPFVMKVNWGSLLFEQGNVSKEHEWPIWRDIKLDDDRILVPGVITHHTYMVESPELVAQRLIRMAEMVGRDHVMGGADCGFCQSAGVPRTEVWTQWAKLRALVEGAEIASKALWHK